MRLFQDLTKAEKIEFFIHGQTLLVNNHQDSDFVIREDNVKERVSHASSLATQYKGLCYQNENIILLYNKIILSGDLDPVAALKAYQWKEPDPNYNAISIDFVVFRELRDCFEWVKSNYDPRIQHVVYVKNGKPQLFKTEALISKIFKLPISSQPPEQ
jgi:hypothetical protein